MKASKTPIKAYIAFSVTGTARYVVATKEVVIAKLSKDFSVVTSRNPKHNVEKDGYKLHWNKLNKTDGLPHTNNGWVTRRFNELNKAGWNIVKDDR